MAEQAARLCKADLVTEMVGEFPELQGLMGGYYARAEGLPDAVADAIRDHYKPVGQGDDVPTAPVTVAVSLADKLDTIAGFFMKDMKPSGSKDPFALRRASIAILSLVTSSKLRGGVVVWLAEARNGFVDQGIADERPENEATDVRGVLEHQFARVFMRDVREFIIDRLKVQQREAGVRHDLIDAVFALGGEDDLVRLLARVDALQSFMETEDGTNLLAGYKRAANILKKEDWQGADDMPHTGEEDPLVLVDDPDMKDIVAAQMEERKNHPAGKALSYAPEPAEKALIDALDTAGPQAETAVQEERFADAMSALASLRKPIDDFFETVTVNDPDEAKRSARLGLLARFRDAVHQVADFGKIEG